MAQKRQNTKVYSHLHTSAFLYVVCEDGDHTWRQVTQSLLRKNTILKHDLPVQRKWTITERAVLKLANLDHSLCFFLKKNFNSKYKAVLIVAPSGYCVYGALLPNTAASVGPGDTCNTSCSPFFVQD